MSSKVAGIQSNSGARHPKIIKSSGALAKPATNNLQHFQQLMEKINETNSKPKSSQNLKKQDIDRSFKMQNKSYLLSDYESNDLSVYESANKKNSSALKNLESASPSKIMDVTEFEKKGIFATYDNGARPIIKKSPPNKSISPNKKTDSSFDALQFKSFDSRLKQRPSQKNPNNISFDGVQKNTKDLLLKMMKDKETEKRAVSNLRSNKVAIYGNNSVSNEKIRARPIVQNRDLFEPRPRPHLIQLANPDASPVKSRATSSNKKTRSQVNIKNEPREVTHFPTEGNEPSFYHEKSFQQNNSAINQSFIKNQKNSKSQKTQFEQKIEKEQINSPSDFSNLNEKEIIEMNSGLLSYYDILIERDQANAKLLQNVKDNFKVMMKEFMKYYHLAKDFDSLRERYEQEIEKLQKEKDLLLLKNQILTKENTKLTELNKKHFLQAEDEEDYYGLNKTKDTKFTMKIQEGLTNERGLLDLLQKREQMILYLKAKESKYIKLLIALKSQGIDIETVYNEEVKNKKTPEKVFEKYKDKVIEDSFDGYDNQKGTVINQFEEPEILEPMSNSEFSHARIISTSSKMYKEDEDDDESSRRYVRDSDDRGYHKDVLPKSHNSKPPLGMPGQQNQKKGLKLDLTSLGQGGAKQEGFHDEIMKMYNEFSSSWRKEMEKDKTFKTG